MRDAIGPRVDLLVEGHCRFGVAQAIRFAQRMAPSNPLWFEEPVPHQDPDSVVEVALHSPVPIATGESFASPKNFAALLRRGGVRIWQPDPMHLGGLWPTRSVIAMADASDIVVAPHSAAGPVCSAVCLQLAACSPNLFIQELFDEFNTGLDARYRRSAPRDRRRRLPRRLGPAGDRDRPGLGTARRPSGAPGKSHPPLRARLGATKERR